MVTLNDVPAVRDSTKQLNPLDKLITLSLDRILVNLITIWIVITNLLLSSIIISIIRQSYQAP
jgi:hypothetical protein